MIDIENLIDVNGLKDLVEIQHDMIMSLKDTLVKKRIDNSSGMGSNNARKINKNARSFY